jgi:DNA-directed RNA polymerase specialized sigma24 family protein
VLILSEVPGPSGRPETLFEQILDREPTPAFAALVADESRRLLECLGDETLRTVALCKLKGHTIDEIAAQLGCGRLTVQRKLRLIRQIWAEEAAP